MAGYRLHIDRHDQWWFIGKNSPSPRTVNYKAKRRARRRRKLANAHRRHIRNLGGSV